MSKAKGGRRRRPLGLKRRRRRTRRALVRHVGLDAAKEPAPNRSSRHQEPVVEEEETEEEEGEGEDEEEPRLVRRAAARFKAPQKCLATLPRGLPVLALEAWKQRLPRAATGPPPQPQGRRQGGGGHGGRGRGRGRRGGKMRKRSGRPRTTGEAAPAQS